MIAVLLESMPHVNPELKTWHDWTNPDFFATRRQQETRFIPLFLRQILPGHILQTRLTWTGWSLIIVSFGLGSAAYNTASNILFLTLSMLLSSLVLSGILSWINFNKLRWGLRAPTHLKVGEVGMAEVDLTNGKTLFPSMAICFQVVSDMSHSTKRIYLHHALRANESIKLEWTFIPPRRGDFQLRLSGVQSQFPFGFLQKTIGSNSEASILVWPARINYTFQASPGGPRISVGASRKNPGVGNDLLNVRPYQHGDPPRLVHWKATARMRCLMVRQLAQEGQRGYHLQLDPSADRWSEEQFERLCSLVCSLADDLFELGRLESVAIGNSSALPIRNVRELHDFFDRLARLSRDAGNVWMPAIVRANRLTFRPCGGSGIAIYVDENKAGQAHD
jgi:uncharacterized protein (DUF58 family)